MSDNAPDLTTRRTRRSPKPPADYGTDSAEVTGHTSPTTAPATPQADDPAVQFNTRVAWSIKKRIDAIKADTGKSIREIVEHAINNTYPEK
jgi:hypothetical protein